MNDAQRKLLAGTLSALSAYILWGVLPLYWKLLDTVPALELLAHRVLWAALLITVVVMLTQRRDLRRALSDRRAVLASLFAGILVGGNWLLYVWAVTSGRIVEASLGYYINPLVNVLLGIIVLRERLTVVQLLALLLAAAGVTVVTVAHGAVPWVSLGLAFSFGVYGLVKKISRLNATVSLMVEMIIVTPVALVIIITRYLSGDGAFLTGKPLVSLLLAGSGVVTVAPLLLFGAGVRRIPLSRVGFLQYVGPTLMLGIGTIIYHEPFTTVHAVSFSCIWAALALYTITLVRRSRKAAPETV
jgi:chloramphenicol-sensitive protein RarD